MAKVLTSLSMVTQLWNHAVAFHISFTPLDLHFDNIIPLDLHVDNIYEKEYYGRMETKGSPWQCQSFQQSSIPSLFDTVKRLLLIRGKGHCKFMLAYVSRAKMWVTQYCIVIFFTRFIQGLWIASSDELKIQKYYYNIIDLFDYKPPCPHALLLCMPTDFGLIYHWKFLGICR